MEVTEERKTQSLYREV